jgi:hypothetical protein
MAMVIGRLRNAWFATVLADFLSTNSLSQHELLQIQHGLLQIQHGLLQFHVLRKLNKRQNIWRSKKKKKEGCKEEMDGILKMENDFVWVNVI